uniref:Angiotensin-converting enzyme n=1 Tax=Ailuropoda melanoleuca TaxID=9646 RepID=A0A7N5KD44_AILME
MGTRWTCHGPSLFVLFCYGKLLPWLRTEGTWTRQGDQSGAGPSQDIIMPTSFSTDKFYNETVAKAFLQFYEHTAQVVWNQFMDATWNYVTNITNKNREEMVTQRGPSTFCTLAPARLFKTSRFQDPAVKRMLSKLQNIDKAALPQDELEEVMDGKAGRSVWVLPWLLSLGIDLQEIMVTSRDQKELLWAWQGWRNAVGHQLRITFERYVQLSNKAAKLNGYKDMGALWRSKYEPDTLEQDLEQLFQELQPLYLKLHAYVRRAAKGRDALWPPLSPCTPLPGNMWAQSWVNILDLVLPFPKKPPEDITKIMKSQHWKPSKMFEEADMFFTSLGLLSTPPNFWKKSMMERPADGREVECHASAWDFYNGKDFRIKKCTEVTIEDLLSIFHRMGHIQYFLQYKNLSVIFRAGANPAFEEAVGSMITLSASSHKHLLNRGRARKEEVNFLMGIALEKIAFIPFAYLMDLFRWKVFDGTIQKDVYNQEWWNLRLKYQGMCPPIPRTKDDFDPGAKFHISASVPYIRYFISLVLQFQLHEALCKALGHMGPLHRDILKLGSSKPWPEVLQKITGQTKVSTKALMTYFKPLLNWLVTENVQQGEILGWPDFSCTFAGLPPSSCLLYKTPMSSTEKDTDKVTFMSLELGPDQTKFGQWVLLAISLVMFLVALLLARRLYSLEKRSLSQDTNAQDTGSRDSSAPETQPKAYFLGIAMETRLVAKRHWILLGLCLILTLYSISLTIRVFTQHYRKPPWMRAEWWSWD